MTLTTTPPPSVCRPRPAAPRGARLAPRPWRWASVAALALALLGPASALAAGPAPAKHSHAPALLQALRGIDTGPSAAVLRRVAPKDTAGQLAAIARDAKVDGWLRVRAVSVLPLLAAESRTPLIALANTDQLPDNLRWWAVRGALRLAKPAPLSQARRWLTSPAWRIRQAAASGLRTARTATVTTLLRSQLRAERHPSVQAALRKSLRGR